MFNTNTTFSWYDSTVTAQNKFDNMWQNEKKEQLELQWFNKETIKSILTQG